MASMIALLTSADTVKISAARAVLAAGGVPCFVFDTGAGGLWGAAIPQRVMVEETDRIAARRLLMAAGFIEAADGDWDLRPNPWEEGG